MRINYNWLDFAERGFEPSRTIQGAELTVQQYLSLVSSGTPVPVHRAEYQSDLKKENLNFEDLDRTRTSGTDLYDVQDVQERDLNRRKEAVRRARSERAKQESESAPKQPIEVIKAEQSEVSSSA